MYVGLYYINWVKTNETTFPRTPFSVWLFRVERRDAQNLEGGNAQP